MNDEQGLHPEAKLIVQRYLLSWLVGVSSILSLVFGVGGSLLLTSIKDASDARADAAAQRAIARFDEIYANQQDILLQMQRSRDKTEQLRENLEAAGPDLERVRQIAADIDGNFTNVITRLAGSPLLASAVAAASGSVVPGSVIAFDLPSCPSGWEPVPQLMGRVVVGAGQGAGLTERPIKVIGGSETVVLTTAQMPRHQHRTVEAGDGSNSTWGLGPPMNGRHGVRWQPGVGTSLTEPVGASAEHENMPPFLALHYCRKVAAEGRDR